MIEYIMPNPNVNNFVNSLLNQPSSAEKIAFHAQISGRPAKIAEPHYGLMPKTKQRLEELGYYPLYAHQARAVELDSENKNFVVSTSAASGKTMCYSIPIMQMLEDERFGTALLIFPTKALTQDQLRRLRELLIPNLAKDEQIAIYDGSTAQRLRADVRQKAKLLLTNPDMLNVGILPYHQNFARFLRNLQYVVIDEAHEYSGVFGSHVSNVLRRLRRVCRIYGASPRFIMSSATIGNPQELAQNLTGEEFSLIDEDGSAFGGRDFIFWNPPFKQDNGTSRQSPAMQAVDLLAQLMEEKIRTICFGRSRRGVEFIFKKTTERLLRDGFFEQASRLLPYRAGYLEEERRHIEQALFSGSLLGICATNAMEMGIDVGGLDASIMCGYPGSISSTWQQAGRSGRSGDKALSVLIAADNPLDQYLMRHAEFFFEGQYENALINPYNDNILPKHLLQAAWEQPLTNEDTQFFGYKAKKYIDNMLADGLLHELHGRYFLRPGTDLPAASINLRSAGDTTFGLINTDTGQFLERLEYRYVILQAYKGAVYLHQGASFVIARVDYENHLVYATEREVNYYTDTKDITEIRILKKLQTFVFGQNEICFGEVSVSTTVSGYHCKENGSDTILGSVDIQSPPLTYNTQALWFNVSQDVLNHASEQNLDIFGGLHAMEHALISIMPLYALCDRNDIGGVSTPFHLDTGAASIFIYDGYAGGVGIAKFTAQNMPKLWQAALTVIGECPCLAVDGCPACIQSPKCGNNNKPLDKSAAADMLFSLLNDSKMG